MASLQLQNLKRNNKKVKSYFTTSKNITSTTEDISIVFPARYINKKLAYIDTEIKVIGIFAVIDKNNNYATVSAPIFLTLTPSTKELITINDNLKDYYQLTFPKNTVVIPNTNCIVRDNFIYDLYDEFFSYGKIPFYLDYNDVSNLFSKAKEYTKTSIGNDMLAFELFASVITRSSKDKTKFLRHMKDKSNYTYVGIKDMIYSYNNTGAKLFGNYLAKGINSAIVENETRSSKTTEILRR